MPLVVVALLCVMKRELCVSLLYANQGKLLQEAMLQVVL